MTVLFACQSPADEAEADCPATPELHPIDPAAGFCVARNLSWLDNRPEYTDRVAALGGRAVRSDLHWHQVQATEGSWDWTVPDAILADAEASGLEFIPMLGYGTPWASSQTDDDPNYPPDDPADYAAFAGAAAERYIGRIQRYEIWNEQNAGYRFWKPEIAGDPVAYGELFLAAEEAIHAADPTAQVIVGGTFFHEQLIPGTLSYTAEMLEAWPQILEQADGVAFHPYTLYPPRVPPESDEGEEMPVWEMIRGLKELTGDLPILITEMGWPSYDPVSEEDQAAWLTRGMLLAQAEGIQDICWYTIFDDDEVPSNQEEAFGLTRLDGAWKPSGEAFAALAERAASATGVGAIEGLDEGSWGVSYGEAGTAYWGEGEVCGVSLGEEPVWVDAQ